MDNGKKVIILFFIWVLGSAIFPAFDEIRGKEFWIKTGWYVWTAVYIVCFLALVMDEIY